ncbi:MarR family transcriptional regulator [Nocardioides sp. zg-579]|uniref:MarR family transcriptional regulator n=1 Tax=Nocardioides marmotae TaxID=2663857 RepID=A0A6I3JE91_9ACTN|nr:MarR family transcriptional regulator [Nocardioides marmotae]MCR6032791.1 MarR family transcriptional regulator [Gordonia jinghuaiqii]MTB96441.1 MarR family transcriptional regulator [Nocardioides marmotae]QKE02033.1 MarR family transcriptional regulator [Nocardioides marmotae]
MNSPATPGRDPIAEARRQWVAHGWDDAAPGMAAVTSIMRAQQLLLTQIDGLLRPFGLTFARFELLRLLSFATEQRMTMRRAGQRLQVHPTSLTSLAARLAEDGHVERVANPKDGRSVVLVLTGSGERLVEEATAVLNAEVFETIGLSAEDVAALVEVLSRFRAGRGDFAL